MHYLVLVSIWEKHFIIVTDWKIFCLRLQLQKGEFTGTDVMALFGCLLVLLGACPSSGERCFTEWMVSLREKQNHFPTPHMKVPWLTRFSPGERTPPGTAWFMLTSYIGLKHDPLTIGWSQQPWCPPDTFLTVTTLPRSLLWGWKHNYCLGYFLPSS